MKSAIKAVFSMLLVLCILPLFVTCENSAGGEDGGEGTFTINLSAGISRAAYPPSDIPGGGDPLGPLLEELRLEVTFIRLDGTSIIFKYTGDGRITGKIAEGEYFLSLNVYMISDDSLYAKSFTSNVNIQRGVNNPIEVQLFYKEPVVALNIITPPSGPSYQGFPPDLTGMVVEITYGDGTISLESNPSKFDALAPGANSSGFSPIVEQGSTPQTIHIFSIYHTYNVLPSNTISINVVDLVSVNATGILHDQLEGFPYPISNLEGIKIEGYYSDSTIRAIPLLTEREENWYKTNEYYRLTDGVTTRTLIDPVSMKISYRVASNDADLPTFAQSTGDAPRTTTGTEIFAEIPFDNFIQIAGITAVNPPTKTYTASSNPWLINWMDELEDLCLVLDHFGGSSPWVDFNYAVERKMASVYAFDNFDLALSNEPSHIILKYELFSGLPGLVQVPLNVVP